MLKKIRIEKHPGTDELEDRYCKATDPVKRSQYRIVSLLSQGKLTEPTSSNLRRTM